MEVIFIKNVDKVADANTVKNVSDGYARNFLFPKGLAVTASPSALRSLEGRQKERKAKEEQEKDSLRQLAAKLDGIEIEILADVGENGKLFGSITSSDIAKKVHEVHGVEIDKKKIHLEDPIKAIGKFEVPVKLASDISAKIKVNVASSSKA